MTPTADNNVIKMASLIIKEADALGAERGGASPSSLIRSWAVAILRQHEHAWNWHDMKAAPQREVKEEDTLTPEENTHIENTDGLVLHVMTGADEGLPLPPDGISVYAQDDVFEDGSGVNERWALCWVRMPKEGGAS